jgi:hypothetical protein
MMIIFYTRFQHAEKLLQFKGPQKQPVALATVQEFSNNSLVKDGSCCQLMIPGCAIALPPRLRLLAKTQALTPHLMTLL